MKLDFESKILIAIVVVMCGLTIIFNIRQSQNEQHFSFLAQSFLNGKTYFLEMPGTWDDTVVFGDRNYRASGLLSALILVPGVWFWGINNWGLFSQAMIQIPAVIGIWILVWLVARRIGWGRREAVWAAVLFCWATVFSGVALWPWSWQFAQVLSVLRRVTLYEYRERANDKTDGIRRYDRLFLHAVRNSTVPRSEKNNATFTSKPDREN